MCLLFQLNDTIVELREKTRVDDALLPKEIVRGSQPVDENVFLLTMHINEHIHM